MYYRNFGSEDAQWVGALSQSSAGRLDTGAFSHPQADEAQSDEQDLEVRAIHLKKQVGGAGHWSLYLECGLDGTLIKLDSIKKGYRVYVGANPAEGCGTETFDVSQPGSMKVGDVYAAMSDVTSQLGPWADTEEKNCRGFARCMLDALQPSLCEPTVQPTKRERKAPDRFDPAASRH